MPDTIQEGITAGQAKELLAAATPGPWTVDEKDPTVIRFASTADWDAGPLDPASVYVQNDAANLALIAAAPDLAQAVIDLTERAEKAERKLDQPCGTCHPCTEWANQTWINAGKRLPHVIEWEDMRERAEKAEAKIAAALQTIWDVESQPGDDNGFPDVVLVSELRAALGGQRS